MNLHQHTQQQRQDYYLYVERTRHAPGYMRDYWENHVGLTSIEATQLETDLRRFQNDGMIESFDLALSENWHTVGYTETIQELIWDLRLDEDEDEDETNDPPF